MGIVLGIKNQKGTVSVENFKNRIRLRWRHQGKRFSLSLWHYRKVNLLEARKVSLQIERGIILNSFDPNLGKYGGRGVAKAGGVGKIKETFVDQFESWLKNYKQLDCELHTNCNSTRNMLKNWGQITESNIQQKLASQKNAAVTYNDRKKPAYNLITEGNRTKVEKAGLDDEIRDGYEFEMTLDFEIINDKHMARTSKDRTGLFVNLPEFIITTDIGRMILNWYQSGTDINADHITRRISECKSIEELLTFYKMFPQF